MEDYVKSRIVEGLVKFHEPIKKRKRLTFQNIAVTKVLKTKGKTISIQAQRNVFGQLILLC